jgi:TonB family protein
MTDLQFLTERNEIAVAGEIPRPEASARVEVRSHVPEAPRFRSLAGTERRSGSRSLGASLGVHALVLVPLAGVRLFSAREPVTLTEPVVVSFYQPKSAEEQRPAAIEKLQPAEPRIAPRDVVLRVPPVPAPPAILPRRPDAPEERVAPPDPLPAAQPARSTVPAPIRALEIPRPPVRTGVFGEASAAPKADRAPERESLTGTFDARATASGRGESVLAVLAGTRVGAFDAEAGRATSRRVESGGGNGGPVPQAGFDAAPRERATPLHDPSGRGEVRRAGFGDTHPVATAPAPRRMDDAVPDQPVEILSKPKPAYTDEARRLRVEGEVVLEVFFGASGSLRVLRVLEGLGHGLNEAAIEAAEQIRFKPARRNGAPMDHTGTLRVVFQLAY